MAMLTEAGWRVEIVWECDFKDEAALVPRLQTILAATSTASGAAPRVTAT